MGDVLVLVTDLGDARRLLFAGERMAAAQGRPLRVIGVKPRAALNEDNGEMLEQLFSLTRSVGAEMTVYFSDEPAAAAARHIRRHHIAGVVARAPENSSDCETIGRIRSAYPELPVQFVDESGYKLSDSSQALASSL